MKKVLILLSLILLGFSSCENDYEDGLSKSDILGKWVSGKNAIVLVMVITVNTNLNSLGHTLLILNQGFGSSTEMMDIVIPILYFC